MAYSDSVTWVLPLLCCPDCGAAIYELDQTHYCCHHCGWHGKDSRDLLCQNPRPRHLVHNRKPSLQPESCLYHLATEPPESIYSGPTAKRDSSEFLSILQQNLSPGDAVLDLGCGPRDQALPLQSLDFQYVGVDIDSSAADYLVDAHALPFVDQSFDAVFSFAVLEHLRDPLMGLVEVARVLKPGGFYLGKFVGRAISCLFFHHTPWGLLALLQQVPELHAVAFGQRVTL